jgi:hypothetical protein
LIGAAVKAGLEAEIDTIIVVGTDSAPPEQVVVLHQGNMSTAGRSHAWPAVRKKTVSITDLIASLRVDLSKGAV